MERDRSHPWMQVYKWMFSVLVSDSGRDWIACDEEIKTCHGDADTWSQTERQEGGLGNIILLKKTVPIDKYHSFQSRITELYLWGILTWSYKVGQILSGQSIPFQLRNIHVILHHLNNIIIVTLNASMESRNQCSAIDTQRYSHHGHGKSHTTPVAYDLSLFILQSAHTFHHNVGHILFTCSIPELEGEVWQPCGRKAK